MKTTYWDEICRVFPIFDSVLHKNKMTRKSKESTQESFPTMISCAFLLRRILLLLINGKKSSSSSMVVAFKRKACKSLFPSWSPWLFISLHSPPPQQNGIRDVCIGSNIGFPLFWVVHGWFAIHNLRCFTIDAKISMKRFRRRDLIKVTYL